MVTLIVLFNCVLFWGSKWVSVQFKAKNGVRFLRLGHRACLCGLRVWKRCKLPVHSWASAVQVFFCFFGNQDGLSLRQIQPIIIWRANSLLFPCPVALFPAHSIPVLPPSAIDYWCSVFSWVCFHCWLVTYNQYRIRYSYRLQFLFHHKRSKTTKAEPGLPSI